MVASSAIPTRFEAVTLRDIYDRVEKTDDIERYETAPRPER